MRSLSLIVVFLLAARIAAAEAQQRTLPDVQSLAAEAASESDGFPAPSAGAPEIFADVSAESETGRAKSALLGFGLGAAVFGGAWIAYYTIQDPLSEGYAVPTILIGAGIGGVAGALIGAILADPASETAAPRRAPLTIAPVVTPNRSVGMGVSARVR